jgi:peptide/nickel transport system substrate-binding protein
MKRELIYAILCILIVFSMVLTSCTTQRTTPSTKTTPQPSTAPATSTPTAQAHWWDKFGEPQYGGTLTVRTVPLAWTSFDPNVVMGMQAYQWEYETLFTNNWTVDRDIWSFKPGFVPVEYTQGLLAESWEQVDPSTVRVQLRQGIHWQNKPPLNGREFTAEDVQYSCDRMLGTGSGFTERTMLANMAIPNVERVVATSKYTVEVHFNQSSALNLLQLGSLPQIAAREWVEQGDLQNWKNAVGTGPWIVSDYVPGTSLTFSKNKDYWGYDERHPQNQVPYLDQLKILEIADPSTALAAFRTGKIDVNSVTIQQSLDLKKTAPKVQIDYWPGPSYNVDMRCDHKPFTDINVRKALEMSINRKAVADTLYGGISDGIPCGLMSPLLKGWAYPYDQWSEELKQEYSYNPDKAKELLAGAGYPDGFKTNIVVSSAQDTEVIQTIKSYFKDIGVDMDVQVLDATAFEAYQNAGKHDQMTIETKAGAPGGPQMQVNLRWSKGIQNYTHNNDAHYDELYEQYLKASSMDEVKRLCVAMDKYALEQHWSVCILPTWDPIALQPWVKGFSGELMILGSAPGTEYARWWIDQNLKQ